MKKFISALQFLTILPIKTKNEVNENKLSLSTVYFPLVGLFLGLVLAGVNNIMSLVPLERFISNVILIASLAILTGGLHLDGLADTFDAISSRKNTSEMLKIMRESHIGTMGVLSLIIIILIKLSLLSSLNPKIINTSLILMCLISRYSLVLSIFLFSYARNEGKAKVFFEGMDLKKISIATLIGLLFSFLLLRLGGLIIFAVAGIFVFLTGKLISNKIGGMTGDTLGAISELTEVFVLLNVLILTGIRI